VSLPQNRLKRPSSAAGGPASVLRRIDALIDELLNESDLACSSVASIMMAARESVRDGYHVALARRIWDIHNDLSLRECPEDPKSGRRASAVEG
jgi:hypothetical protein